MGQKLRIAATSEYTKIAVSTLYKKTMKREIPHFKVGRILLFDTDQLDQYLESHRRKTEQEIVNESLSKMRKGRLL
jgi:excisionase family DNA binding protein